MNYESQTLSQVTNEDLSEGIFVFPEDITSIGNQAFIKCTDLTTINIPNSVTSIGDRAFAECTGLTSINIPNSVTAIGNEAFYGCTSFTTINIPNSVTTIDSEAFYECTGLTTINIPNSVTSIGLRAFYKCTDLTTINISNSITAISSATFSGCTGLTAINIPNSITAIDYAAFDGCTGLTSIHLPSSVTVIGIAAFRGCTHLTTMNIPSSITSIDYWAFEGCSNLNSIIINTEDKTELKRIINLLPSELKEKATPPPSKILNERCLVLEEFNAKAYPGSLPIELSRTIFSYDDWTSEPNLALKKELDNAAIPHSLDDLTQYKSSLNELLERHLTCFHLKQYQEKIKKITSNNNPFFSSNAPVANHSILNICNLIDRLIAIILKPDVIPPLSLNEKELLSTRPSLLQQIPVEIQQQIGMASLPNASNEEIEPLSKTHHSP